MNTSFYLKPTEGTFTKTEITLTSKTPPAIVGTVVDENKNPIENALITVFTSGSDVSPDSPIAWGYTDEYGTFTIGPLETGTLYYVRVSKMSQSFRVLEM